MRSLTSVIRRPAQYYSLKHFLELNSKIESGNLVKPVWWENYFLFVKKAFEILHYVFNWVDQSSNIIVNDDQFLHFLFVLIPVKGTSLIYTETKKEGGV